MECLLGSSVGLLAGWKGLKLKTYSLVKHQVMSLFWVRLGKSMVGTPV